MSSFHDKVNEGYYDDKPKSTFWEDLDRATILLQQENAKFSIEFNKNIDVFRQAKALEKTDVYKAIELYESIKNTNYGKFDCIGRLIVLYRKTKQKDKEKQHIEFKIEELQNLEYDRMIFLQNRFPDESENIKQHYENGGVYTTPELQRIDFHSRIEKLKSKLKINQP